MTNKAKTRKQISFEYGICTKTFQKWLLKEGIILRGGLISPNKQQIIYQKFGIPKDSYLFPNIPKVSNLSFSNIEN